MHTSRTFVLRCWEEGEPAPDAQPAWRLMLEEVGQDRRTRGFGSFEAMVSFLRSELVHRRPPSPAPTEEP